MTKVSTDTTGRKLRHTGEEITFFVFVFFVKGATVVSNADVRFTSTSALSSFLSLLLLAVGIFLAFCFPRELFLLFSTGNVLRNIWNEFIFDVGLPTFFTPQRCLRHPILLLILRKCTVVGDERSA